jgi:hypothetical protein
MGAQNAPLTWQVIPMNPEDCVLVGVIKRKRDLRYARKEGWYRIPKQQMPRGFQADYVAFFLSGSATEKSQPSGIYSYAAVNGHELAYRRDLLPREATHKRADKAYYRIALDEICEKNPPILNPTNRPIVFVYTTWDRFIHAAEISDLYSKMDFYVDRIQFALRRQRIPVQRRWDSEKQATGLSAGLQIVCKNGIVEASTSPDQGTLFMDEEMPEDKILAAIRAEIARQGGPVTVNIPMEGL